SFTSFERGGRARAVHVLSRSTPSARSSACMPNTKSGMTGCSGRCSVGRWWQACGVAEELLPGGFVTEVVRVGDTVRRRPGRNAGFVHRLLEWLEWVGWNGAPRFRGVDEQCREILSF